MNDFENVSADISGYVTMIMHTGKYNFDTDEIEDGEQVARRDLKNLIVNRSSALLSAALLPKNNIAITHLAVGVGNEDGLMPIEDIRYNKLIKEVRRVKIDRYGLINSEGKNASLDFPDEVCGAVLKASLNLSNSDNGKELVEMGLFGGPGADQPNSGLMFNYKSFSNWTVPEDVTLSVIWRLYFGQKKINN